jgi:short-subunit dehydrogenase
VDKVTIASVLGLMGVPQLSDYCASKGALLNLHESLRYELNKRYVILLLVSILPTISLFSQLQRTESPDQHHPPGAHHDTHVLSHAMAQFPNLEILCAIAPADHRRQGGHPYP